jgi:hypothetical protein
VRANRVVGCGTQLRLRVAPRFGVAIAVIVAFVASGIKIPGFLVDEMAKSRKLSHIIYRSISIADTGVGAREHVFGTGIASFAQVRDQEPQRELTMSTSILALRVSERLRGPLAGRHTRFRAAARMGLFLRSGVSFTFIYSHLPLKRGALAEGGRAGFGRGVRSRPARWRVWAKAGCSRARFSASSSAHRSPSRPSECVPVVLVA